jgi:hypothetical protein
MVPPRKVVIPLTDEPPGGPAATGARPPDAQKNWAGKPGWTGKGLAG